MWKKLIATKFNSITAAAMVLAVASLLSRLVGLIRDRILASQFGAGDALDIYYAAFRIPDFIYSLVIAGTVTAGFIPVFSSLIKDDEALADRANEAAWKLASNVLNFFALILVLLCLILAIFTPWLLPLLTPGFNNEKMYLAVQLTRIMFISPILFGLSGVFGGILQSFRRFINFAFAPILYNLGIIFGALFLVPYFGLPGLAIGVVLGALLHLLAQVIGVFRLGFSYEFILSWRDSHLRQMIKLTLPRLLGFICYYLNAFVVTIFASLLAAGSLAIYSLADNLQSFLVGIFGTAFAVAAFPTLAKKFNVADEQGFCQVFHRTLRQVLFFILPSASLVLILRMQIVRLVLGSGAFDWQDTILTANTLGVFSLGLFASALNPLLVRAFYARQNAIMPFFTFFFSIIFNIAFNIIFVKKLGVFALAIGFTASTIINFILLAVLLKIKNAAFWRDGLGRALAQISLATLLMGVTTQYVKTWVGGAVDMQRFWGVLTQSVSAALAGLAVFMVISLLLKSEELLNLIESLRQRLWRQAKIEKEGMTN